jgi:hypothetical protein
MQLVSRNVIRMRLASPRLSSYLRSDFLSRPYFLWISIRHAVQNYKVVNPEPDWIRIQKKFMNLDTKKEKKKKYGSGR